MSFDRVGMEASWMTVLLVIAWRHRQPCSPVCSSVVNSVQPLDSVHPHSRNCGAGSRLCIKDPDLENHVSVVRTGHPCLAQRILLVGEPCAGCKSEDDREERGVGAPAERVRRIQPTEDEHITRLVAMLAVSVDSLDLYPELLQMISSGWVFRVTQIIRIRHHLPGWLVTFLAATLSTACWCGTPLDMQLKISSVQNSIRQSR